MVQQVWGCPAARIVGVGRQHQVHSRGAAEGGQTHVQTIDLSKTEPTKTFAGASTPELRYRFTFIVQRRSRTGASTSETAWRIAHALGCVTSPRLLNWSTPGRFHRRGRLLLPLDGLQ